jgi:hypothetical protein
MSKEMVVTATSVSSAVSPGRSQPVMRLTPFRHSAEEHAEPARG